MAPSNVNLDLLGCADRRLHGPASVADAKAARHHAAHGGGADDAHRLLGCLLR